MPPPNTPEEGLVATTTTATTTTTTNTDTNINTNTATLALRPLMSGENPAALDLRALEYEDSVDENLICPICRVPFVSPVITDCDHVFCQRCIVQAHALNPVCPVDRLPLKLASETRPAPKIVHNQLDSLPVRCPNSSRGCALVVARALVENHVARYCDKSLVPCPHPSCPRSVLRRDLAQGCLHYDVECEYCARVIQKADLDAHLDTECPNRKAECELCAAEYVRHRWEEHARECPEAETSCRFAPFGCEQLVKRRRLDEHAVRCAYRVVGPVGEQLAELRAELNALQERDRLKDRRIKFLENRGFPLPTPTSPEPISDMNLPPEGSSTHEDSAPYESRDQYFLSLFEAMESKVERLSSALNEVEGRHSVMLFNESSQIKDQLTEIRSTMGVLGMHVRWLMNFRLQERGRAGTSAPAMSGPLSGGNHENIIDDNISRRMIVNLREHPPRL